MGGVDKLDWYINKYRMKIRSKKWYFPIFINIVDTAVAHILYSQANERMPFLEFRRKIVRTYM